MELIQVNILSGVISTPGYESAGPNSNPGPISQRIAHPVYYPPFRVDRYIDT